ncbi:MAG: tRNA pseudouridine(38-40) synthase TruA [Candidatus Latescibacteria bacterium]|nr:tRNA pseudouridine(38-40) synthase TruA [Candidatus Latescibacterota bacterium]
MNPPSSDRQTATRTLRLELEYDGTDFVGWQIQRQGRTIQGELSRVLHILLKEEIRPVASGRTDAGTHALGQVAHFHTSAAWEPDRLQRALNGLLPPDIAVIGLTEAPERFHARFSAVSKRYRYRIGTAKTALHRGQVWPVYFPLALEPLQQATQDLLGTHHFSAFCKRDPEPENFHCQIIACNWRRQDRELIFEIEGNRFLRHMVRILVGTMAQMAAGRRPPTDLAELLRQGDRQQAGPTAPAQGLCLVRVHYPDFS